MNNAIKQTIRQALEFAYKSSIPELDLDAALAAIDDPLWTPVKGPVIIELGPRVMVVFRADSAEALGATEFYPKGYLLCECRLEGSKS